MEQHQFGLREWADLCERKDATIAALQAQLESANVLLYKKNCALGRAETIINDLQSQLTQRTAELEAAKAIQAIDLKNNNAYREQVANLQAELERVRGERDEAISKVDKWRDKWLERGAELVKPCEQCGHSSFDPTQRVVQSQHRQGMEG